MRKISVRTFPCPDALNCSKCTRASVYIAVGGEASSAGKVMVDTKKGRIELTARTNDIKALRPGQVATILQADGGVLWITADEKGRKTP